MKQFANLFLQLDQTSKTNAKVDALAKYFSEASGPDKVWTIAILSHKRPKRSVTTTQLREWAAEYAGLPLWLFEESYGIVGDLAETIALILPPPPSTSQNSLSQWIQLLQGLKSADDHEKKELVVTAWQQLTHPERFVFNKLITGGFRMGVSQKLMTRALSKYTEIETNVLAHRLMGDWAPGETTFEELVFSENSNADHTKPYPFYLAHPLETPPEELGEPDQWLAERKWDGIRGQVILRGGEIFVWSRGEELVTDKFPEYQALVSEIPDGTVLDGEILPWKNGRPLPFQLLQTRIGRKNITKGVLEKSPVILMAYDLLEWEGEDVRDKPMQWRREKLEELFETHPVPGVLRLSPRVDFDNWDTLAEVREHSREHFSEGLMLKKMDSPYEVGRKRGNWWKWKVEPLTIDAVMIYGQRGHGRRANLYTDYTFAVWDGDALVPFTKAYSGLTDAEFKQVDRFIKQNTVERFGPVRSVKPELVFEIAFEGIQESSRHKSGVALRFPRMKRWRQDKPASEANTLQDLKDLLAVYGPQT